MWTYIHREFFWPYLGSVSMCWIAQFRYFKIQLEPKDITTRLRRINHIIFFLYYSPKPCSDVFCFKLNFNILKLGYYKLRFIGHTTTERVAMLQETAEAPLGPVMSETKSRNTRRIVSVKSFRKALVILKIRHKLQRLPITRDLPPSKRSDKAEF